MSAEEKEHPAKKQGAGEANGETAGEMPPPPVLDTVQASADGEQETATATMGVPKIHIST